MIAYEKTINITINPRLSFTHDDFVNLGTYLHLATWFPQSKEINKAIDKELTKFLSNHSAIKNAAYPLEIGKRVQSKKIYIRESSDESQLGEVVLVLTFKNNNEVKYAIAVPKLKDISNVSNKSKDFSLNFNYSTLLECLFYLNKLEEALVVGVAEYLEATKEFEPVFEKNNLLKCLATDAFKLLKKPTDSGSRVLYLTHRNSFNMARLFCTFRGLKRHCFIEVFAKEEPPSKNL